MLDIKGTKLTSLPINDLEWVRDLENFEGPLLSLFRHRRHGDNYLYYWCDRNEEINRWMVLRVSETNVIRLVHRLIPLDQVIPRGCQDDFVYIVDMANGGLSKRVVLSAIESVPDAYMPEQGAFLDAQVAEQLGSYSVVIERDLSIDKWRDLFRHFSCAYAFLYNIIALKSQKIKSHPWRGGFSGMHFWEELLNFIPVEDSPSLETLQYASPGFIRFKLRSDIAVMVGNLVAGYLQSHEKIRETYRNLMTYFRTNHLNDDLAINDPKWQSHDANLSSLTESLLTELRISSPLDFINASPRPFEAAKMATAFARRIIELASFESDRLIRFPNFID